ncbi:MAG: imidazole glycerol phosphate synthase subunit HisF [Chloroflexi bacterium]|nr:imidazole glycerol phosphate synthase subunit HisF [Chloroflexota bacterium]
MLKRRLIPCLFLQNGLIVRSQEFRQFKQLGNPTSQLERLNSWDSDELIYVDITREGQYDLKRDDLKIKSRSDILSILQDIARCCFMPLTFGGRIRDLETVDAFIANGADKVVINTGAYLQPELIAQVAEKYGSQAMVVAVDVMKDGPDHALFIHNGRERAEKKLEDWVKEVQRRGAGEVFLNSIDRDGTGSGYDLEVIRRVCEWVDIPVIACGGAGGFEDFLEVLEKTPASAVAAGNIFNFTENAYRRAKKFLAEAGATVR